MTSARRPRGRIPAIAFALALATVGTLIAGRPAAASAVTVQVAADDAPPGSWSTVTVTVVNHGGDFRGHVDVTEESTGTASSCVSANVRTYCPGMGGAYLCCTGLVSPVDQRLPTITYRVPITVAAGANRAIPVHLIGHGRRVSAAVVDDSGAQVAATAAPTPTSGATGFQGSAVLPAQPNTGIVIPRASGSWGRMAVISDDPTTLGTIDTMTLPSFQNLTYPGCPTCGYTSSSATNIAVTHIGTSAVPDSGVTLSSLNVVVIDDATTDQLSAAQRQALSDYVSEGGTLIVVGGPNARTTTGGLDPALLPARVTGSTVSSLATLSTTLDVPSLTGSVPVSTLQPTDGQVLLTAPETPLLISASRGRGHVVVAAMDIGNDPLASWEGTPTLLRQILLATGWNGASVGSGIDTRSQLLEPAVASLPGVVLPSEGFLEIVLIVYIVVVGPANYLVLRWRRRRDLAWITVPVISIVGAAMAYGTGLGVGTHGMVANTVRIAQLQAGQSRAFTESYTAVYVPHGGTHVATTDGGYVTGMQGLPGTETGVTVEGAGSTNVSVVNATPASVHGFSTAGFASLNGRIDASLSASGATLDGSVTNHLGVGLRDVTIIDGNGGIQSVGTLADGQTIPVTGVISGAATPNPATDPSAAAPDASSVDDPATRERLARTAIITALTQMRLGGAYPVLVGIADHSIGSVPLTGPDLVETGLDTVVMPLTATSQTSGPRRESGQLVNSDGSFQAGLLNPGKAADYAFPIGTGSWSPLSLSVTARPVVRSTPPVTRVPMPQGPAPAVPPYTPPPTPSPEPVSVSVYNVHNGHWDSLGTVTAFGVLTIAGLDDHISGVGTVLIRVSLPADAPYPVSLPTPFITATPAVTT